MGILAILLNFAELGANDGMILSTLVRSAQPPAPWASSCLINSGDKNSLPYQNNLLQGISNINFVFMGEARIRQLMVFFLSPCWAGLAPVAPLPPDGFVLVRREGGLCGGFCAFAGLVAVLRRGVLAGRQGHSIFLSEISIVRYHYKMYTRAFSCKDAFSFSLRSPSLSISSSSLDPCILY